MAHSSGVGREPLEGHDGRSGASIERVRTEDGRTLIVKRSSPNTDVVMQLLRDDTGVEYRLWSEGILDRLPPGVGHTVVDARLEGSTVVTVMRDVTPHVVGWERRLSADELRRVITAGAALHRAFAGADVEGVVPLGDWIGLMGPRRLGTIDSDNPLVPLVARGWELFADVAPPEIASAIFRAHEDPAALASRLEAFPTTLLHGDMSVVNMAVEPAQVTLLDWGLATQGPPALDIAWLLVSSASVLPLSREEVLDEHRRAEGDLHDEDALRLALFAALMTLGWNKALDVVENPDPAVRTQERADLDWWIARSLEAAL